MGDKVLYQKIYANILKTRRVIMNAKLQGNNKLVEQYKIELELLEASYKRALLARAGA